jgi:hypothetical protein
MFLPDLNRKKVSLAKKGGFLSTSEYICSEYILDKTVGLKKGINKLILPADSLFSDSLSKNAKYY